MRYTDHDLAKLIEDVELEFTAHLAKSEVSLSKSEKDEKEPKEDEGKEDEGKEDEGKEDEEELKSKSKESPEPAEHDYDDEDLEHMHKMYGSMSKGELSAHHSAIMKCMGKAEIEPCDPHGAEGKESAASEEQDEIAKADGCGGEMSASNPKGSPGKKAGASSDSISKTETGKIEASLPGKTPGAKSEASKANGEKMDKSEVELLKSELEASKAKNDEIKKNFEAVSEFLTKLAKKTAPASKAITSLDAVAKSEGFSEEKSLTKSEITGILLRKASDPTLSKSDRQAINAFYEGNGANINSISHLLK